MEGKKHIGGPMSRFLSSQIGKKRRRNHPFRCKKTKTPMSSPFSLLPQLKRQTHLPSISFLKEPPTSSNQIVPPSVAIVPWVYHRRFQPLATTNFPQQPFPAPSRTVNQCFKTRTGPAGSTGWTGNRLRLRFGLAIKTGCLKKPGKTHKNRLNRIKTGWTVKPAGYCKRGAWVPDGCVLSHPPPSTAPRSSRHSPAPSRSWASSFVQRFTYQILKTRTFLLKTQYTEERVHPERDNEDW